MTILAKTAVFFQKGLKTTNFDRKTKKSRQKTKNFEKKNSSGVIRNFSGQNTIFQGFRGPKNEVQRPDKVRSEQKAAQKVKNQRWKKEEPGILGPRKIAGQREEKSVPENRRRPAEFGPQKKRRSRFLWFFFAIFFSKKKIFKKKKIFFP